MSEFQELIKNFNKCRDYVREFFVYGFKSRLDFSAKSSRTYDDERRRIESWLHEYVKTDYATDAKEDTVLNGSTLSKRRSKNISLQMDSNLLDTNPLYRVWKTKSFTDNDIMLHFFLMDILDEGEMSINELTDEIIKRYDVIFDAQMIRRKCNEYVKEGLLLQKKNGKTTIYKKNITFRELLPLDSKQSAAFSQSLNVFPISNPLLEAVRFFHLSAPFGMLGSTLLDNQKTRNTHFRIKHSFLVHTLEDEIVLQLLNAMREKREVTLHCQSNKNMDMRKVFGVPLQFFVSTRTGRRYICLSIRYKRSWQKGTFISPTSIRHFQCLRLDQIKKVDTGDEFAQYNELRVKLNQNKDRLWGVSFDNSDQSRRQHVKLTLRIDEEKEPFILERLQREGKGGTILHVDKNTYTYEKEIFDPQEMLPWLRTFIGRILSIETNNRNFSSHFQKDLETMYQMYDIE